MTPLVGTCTAVELINVNQNQHEPKPTRATTPRRKRNQSDASDWFRLRFKSDASEWFHNLPRRRRLLAARRRPKHKNVKGFRLPTKNIREWLAQNSLEAGLRPHKDQTKTIVQGPKTREPKTKQTNVFIKSQKKCCAHKSEVEPITGKRFFRFYGVC